MNLNLTPERRREIARQGVLARAKKYQEKRLEDNNPLAIFRNFSKIRLPRVTE